MSKLRIIFLFCIAVALFSLVFVSYGGGWSGGASRGSLDVSVTGWGLGKLTAVRVAAKMAGYAICQNNGENFAPGLKLVTIDAPEKQTDQLTDRNGKVSAFFEWSNEELFSNITWDQAGCPNANWTVSDMLSSELWITVWELEDGTPIERTRGEAYCTMNPPSNHGDFVCTWS